MGYGRREGSSGSVFIGVIGDRDLPSGSITGVEEDRKVGVLEYQKSRIVKRERSERGRQGRRERGPEGLTVEGGSGMGPGLVGVERKPEGR